MTFEMLLKAPLAISIGIFISPSHFPLSVIKCPRYINFLTCSIALPSSVVFVVLYPCCCSIVIILLSLLFILFS